MMSTQPTTALTDKPPTLEEKISLLRMSEAITPDMLPIAFVEIVLSISARDIVQIAQKAEALDLGAYREQIIEGFRSPDIRSVVGSIINKKEMVDRMSEDRFSAIATGIVTLLPDQWKKAVLTAYDTTETELPQLAVDWHRAVSETDFDVLVDYEIERRKSYPVAEMLSFAQEVLSRATAANIQALVKHLAKNITPADGEIATEQFGDFLATLVEKGDSAPDISVLKKVINVLQEAVHVSHILPVNADELPSLMAQSGCNRLGPVGFNM